MCPLGADQYVIYILDLSTWQNSYTVEYIMYFYRHYYKNWLTETLWKGLEDGHIK